MKRIRLCFSMMRCKCFVKKGTQESREKGDNGAGRKKGREGSGREEGREIKGLWGRRFMNENEDAKIRVLLSMATEHNFRRPPNNMLTTANDYTAPSFTHIGASYHKLNISDCNINAPRKL